MTSPGQEEIDLLARAVLGVLKDGHREAIIKCLYIWSAVQAGTFSTNAETIELLQRYPSDLRTRAAADSAVRAMWGAHRALLLDKDERHFANTIQWAKVWVDQLYTLIRISMQILGTDKEAVESAFSWLGDIEDEETSES